MRNNLKNVIFDLDGTLTESRSSIENKMTYALTDLYKKYNLVVISGAERKQMLKQIFWLEESPAISMSESGNYSKQGSNLIFRNLLTFQDLQSVLLHLSDIYDANDMGEEIGGDRIEVRGGQISWSLLGHNYPKNAKKIIDPFGNKRREMLKKTPFLNDDMMVKIGGTTCLDYTRIGWGKKGNLERLLKLNNWKKEDCVYVGDQLYEGGNDEEVKELMEVFPVKNPEETLNFIKTIL